MKTNKHLTLRLANSKGVIRASDVVNEFDYSNDTARSYLSRLGRQGLLERTRSGHCLTEKGRVRLLFFDLLGCRQQACPSCKGKSGYLTCPYCLDEITLNEARITPEWNFFVRLGPDGVYCPTCYNMLIPESEARLLG